jgi:hypothetical protein
MDTARGHPERSEGPHKRRDRYTNVPFVISELGEVPRRFRGSG